MHPDAPIPDSVPGQLAAGAACFRAGAADVIGQPALWPFVFVPALLTLTGLVLALSVAFSSFEVLAGWLLMPAPDASALWSGVLAIARWTARLLILIVAGMGAYLLAGLVAVPFNDRLSDHIETQLLGPTDEPVGWRTLIGDLLVSLAHTGLGLLLWATCMAVLFVLNVIPGVGSLLATVGSLFVSGLLIARETMDGCMSRRRFSFAHKLRVVRNNLWFCLGLGAAAWLFMWIPLMNFLVLPMAVAGGCQR